MPTRQPPSSPCQQQRRVAVAQVGDQFQVRALSPIAAGETILEIHGEVTDRPSRLSVQIDDHAHIEVPAGQDLETSFDRSPWRFLNHACAPNAAIHGRTLVAACAIAAGEEVTFDYNTTEYEMAAPFRCHCGAPACLGSIRGFRYLTMEQRQLRHERLAPHLLRRLADDPIQQVERTDG